MARQRKALILSVGYGEGHHAAAHAMREEWESRGWRCRVEDVCQKATPAAFRLTQRFYQFCVRRLPWLWGVTYAQTETPNWAETLRFPIVSKSLEYLASLIESENPDIVICTYPLFAYMLDALKEKGKLSAPYVVIVTDALEISRPWMRTKAPLVCVPDALSRKLVLERYGLPEQRVVAAGFPVKRAFAAHPTRGIPNENNLKIIYGAYAPTRRVCRDIRTILAGIPGSAITLIAGTRKNKLCRYLIPEQLSGRLHIIERTDAMHRLFLDSHLYIGKAGAATMFEAYAAGIPMVVNYALPGQEQGNLELLLSDGAGVYAESTQDLLSALHALLMNGSAGWLRMHADMKRAARAGAAPRIADEVERRFFA
ncbi:MAG: hypothetical protein IJ985_05890 [Akkermansia sp.]|nr:hypothetical protein [Akkermansia sp.]